MRTVELLQVFGSVAGALFSALAAIEQGLLRRLRAAGATSAERAVHLPGLRPLTRWRLARLEKAEAVKVLDSGAVFIDEESFHRLRRRRILTAVAGVIVAVGLILLTHAFL